MPTKQEMLDRIYEVIADKTLTVGCLVKHVDDQYYNGGLIPRFRITDACYKDLRISFGTIFIDGLELTVRNYKVKPIGHPVMIGDVLDWMSKNFSEMNYESGRFSFVESVYIKRKELREPIEHQSDECIKFVYSILPTK